MRQKSEEALSIVKIPENNLINSRPSTQNNV